MNRNPSRLSWRQFLSYHANIAPVRVLFNCPEIEHRAMLASRRVRSSVYAENHPGLQGRAMFAPTYTAYNVPSHGQPVLAGLI